MCYLRRRGRAPQQMGRMVIAYVWGLVPVFVLMFVVMFLGIYTNAPWQGAAQMAGLVVAFVIISLMIQPPLPQERISGSIAVGLLCAGVYCASGLALYNHLTWLIVAAPGLFLLLAALVYNTRRIQVVLQRLALLGATLLFLLLLYLADIMNYWWEMALICLGAASCLYFVCKALPWRRRYVRTTVIMLINLLSFLMICVTLAVGAVGVFIHQDIRSSASLGVRAAVVASIIAGYTSSLFLLRTRVTLWSSVTALMLCIMIALVPLHPLMWWEIVVVVSSLVMLVVALWLVHLYPVAAGDEASVA